MLQAKLSNAEPALHQANQQLESARAEAREGVRAAARNARICTALQLINFWQDVALDYARNRIYLPLADMQRLEVSEAQLGRGETSASFRALMRFQTRDVLVLPVNAAVPDALKSEDGAQQGRLAHPVATQHAGDGTRLGLHADRPQGVRGTIKQVDLLDPQHGHLQRRSPSLREGGEKVPEGRMRGFAAS